MLEVMSEAERLFHNDVREKKRAASGVHSKTGKNGYVGTMRFPTDLMSRKEKYKYRKAGKVMTTNLFDEILTLEEFEKLEKNEQRNRLSYWRLEHSNEQIKKSMGISNVKYYNFVKELELPKAPRSHSKSQKKTKDTNTQKSKLPAPQKQAEEAQETVKETPVQELIFNGLRVDFNGTYSAEKIEKQLTKIMLLLDEEEDEFYIEMKLVQKQSKANY